MRRFEESKVRRDAHGQFADKPTRHDDMDIMDGGVIDLARQMQGPDPGPTMRVNTDGEWHTVSLRDRTMDKRPDNADRLGLGDGWKTAGNGDPTTEFHGYRITIQDDGSDDPPIRFTNRRLEHHDTTLNEWRTQLSKRGPIHTWLDLTQPTPGKPKTNYEFALSAGESTRLRAMFGVGPRLDAEQEVGRQLGYEPYDSYHHTPPAGTLDKITRMLDATPVGPAHRRAVENPRARTFTVDGRKVSRRQLADLARDTFASTVMDNARVNGDTPPHLRSQAAETYETLHGRRMSIELYDRYADHGE